MYPFKRSLPSSRVQPGDNLHGRRRRNALSKHPHQDYPFCAPWGGRHTRLCTGSCPALPAPLDLRSQPVVTFTRVYRGKRYFQHFARGSLSKTVPGGSVPDVQTESALLPQCVSYSLRVLSLSSPPLFGAPFPVPLRCKKATGQLTTSSLQLSFLGCPLSSSGGQT